MTSSNLFARSIQTTQQKLTAFAQQSNFLAIIDRSFGTGFDSARLTQIQQQWLAGDFRSLPEVEIVDASGLGTAVGAYGASTNQIYLSADFVNSADELAISAVLTEEIGHWVDGQINATDTPGDEGEFFAALVWNRDLSAAQLSQIQQEDDSKTISVDGRFVLVERANFPGTPGNDTYPGTPGNDTYPGTPGDDTINGLDGADNLGGGDGNDTISGGAGIDTIAGGNGDDIINPVTSDGTLGVYDRVDGGADIDTLVLDYSGKPYYGGLVVNSQNLVTGAGDFSAQVNTGNYLGQNAAHDRVVYSNIEKFNITGTNLNDNISGGNSDDRLVGGAGDDKLDGHLGVDIIDGGVGNDTAGADVSTTITATNIDLTNTTNTLANGTQLLNIEAVNVKLGAADDTVIAGNFDDTVNAGAGNDVIDVKNGVNVVTGDAGNDQITAGSGADNLSGDDGNDNIFGGAGVDTITGGIGDDTLSSGTSDGTLGVYDRVDGGADTDTLVLDYSGKTYYAGLVVNSQNLGTGGGDFSAQVNTGNYLGQNSAHDRVVYSNIEKFNITGTNLNDNISGGNSDDRLVGGAGDDKLDGHLGVDIIDGGIGNDTAGADVSTTITATNINLANATNTLANGTQLLNIEAVNLKLGSASDTVIAGDFDDTVNGGAGNDVVDVKNGMNVVTGEAGNDQITSGSGADNLSGDDGNDNISGGAGVDTITGGNGDDTIGSGTSDSTLGVYDRVDGGADTDTLVLDYSGKTYYAGLVVNSQNLVTGGGDFSAQVNTGNYLGQNAAHDRVVYSNIEKFNITGTDKADNISGGNSDDRLVGGAGDDKLDGHLGVDIIDGGIGNDTAVVDVSSTTTATSINLANATNTLANGTQLLNIEAVNLKLGSASDTVIAGDFDDTVDAAAGDDIIDVKNGNNVVIGGAGNDQITSGSGADNLSGGDDNDIISGGAGVDTITGGIGDDTLNSGTSDGTLGVYDRVDGGTDTDTLVLDYSGKAYYAGLVVNSQNLVTGGGDFSAQVNTGNYLGQNAAHDRVVYSNIEKFNITGTDKADNISGGNSADRLVGGKGNDTIIGNAGNDTIIGIDSKDTNPGNAEIDTFTGGLDNDIFVLAANGKDFYATSGNGDYAKITDFSITQDVIQLRGAATDYSVTATTIGGSLPAVGGVIPPNTALYRGTELIAVLQGVSSASVNLTSTAFSYTNYTIINDLPPIVTISNATPVAEGQSGTSIANFTVKLTSPTTKTVIVPYSTADGTATTGDSDYIGTTTGSVTFLTGETSKDISVVINSDTNIEPDETFTITLGAPTNATLGIKTIATGTIISDDTTVTISNSVNAVEGTNPGQFTLTRAGVIANTLTVPYTLTGTATNGSDYNIPLSATFAAGSTTAVVNLNAIDDPLFEGTVPETVIVTLTAGTTYNLGSTPTATITIADNDTQPTVSVSSTSIAEGNSGNSNATFTIGLSNPTTETVTVDYSTADGTATAGSDYTATTGTVTFEPNQISKTVNVSIAGDLNFEGNETFSVNLANPMKATLGTATNGTGTINNDDLPTISVTVTDANAAEILAGQPANPGEFTFTRAGGETVEKTFLYTLSGTSTNGADYSIPGSVTFTAGSTTAKITINPTDDNIFEGATPETAILTLIDDSYYDGSYYSTHQYDRAATYRVDPANNTGTIAIADNDSRPTINIADSTPRAEGNTGTSNTPFTVTLSNPTIETVTVDYAAANVTATSDSDYTATNGTVTFTPLQTSKTINVPVTGDQIGEDDETYSVTLTNAVGGTIGKATGTGTILNDESGIAVSVSDGDAGEANNNHGQFLLTRSGELNQSVTVNYTLSGTATAGLDYQNLAGIATFAANQATVSIDLRVLDDTIFEGATPEKVTLTVTPSTNYVVSSANSGTIDLVDNDPRPTISVGNIAIAEGNTGISNAGFTVSLSNASTETVTVNLSTQDGTATVANNDYQAVTNQLFTFAPGQTSQVVNVAVNGDLTFETNETFSAVLSNASNGVVSSIASTGTGTINNDDLPTISVVVSDANAAETLTGQLTNFGEFTFTRVGGEATEKTFLYTFSGTANGLDYSMPGTVTFAAGSTTAKVTLNPTDDNLFEGATPETVILTLKDDSYNSPTNFYVASDNRPATYRIEPVNNSGTISIADNDLRPTISIDNISLIEGNNGTKNATFTLKLSNPSVEAVTVDYSTADGTATAGSDYTATTGTVTFNPGQTTQTINIPVIGDLVGELDETFTVNLTNPNNATGITTAIGTGTIINDDALVTVVGTANGTEGSTTPAKFTLTRAGATTAALTVAYTLSGTTTNGVDYTVPANVTFAAGSNTAIVDLSVIDDNIFEGATPETAILTLTAGTDYTVGSIASATVNITDNDSRPTVTIGNTSRTEGNSGNTNATFTVSLSNPSTETVTVDYSTVGDTATAGSDYTAVTGSVTFTPGQTSQTINVPVIGDLNFESNETFNVNLANPTNATLGTTVTGIGTIVNDDLPTISVVVTDADAAETSTGQPANPGEFTFTRSGITTDAKTVLFSMSGTAGGSDYTIPASVTFAAGSSTATLSLSAIDDNIFEGATLETAILTLRDDRIDNLFGILSNNRPPTYLVDAVNNTSTVNITDNDRRPTVAIGNVSQAEGNSGTTNFGFDLSLSNPTVEPVTVDYNTADGTATVVGTTSLDPDYTAKSGTVTFTPAQTSQTINVAVNGDRDFEADKTFTVNLTNAKNTTGITTATGTGSIVNDDTLPSITVAATTATATENGTPGLFTFYRTGGNLDRSLTVDFDLLGNASTRQGYGTSSGSVTFAAGSNTATLPVPVANNGVFNAYRSCVVRLRSGGGYSIGGGAGGSGGSGGGAGGFGGGEATVNIVDDDTTPVVSINDIRVTEGNSGITNATFSLKLSNASDDFVTLDYNSVDGTATTADGDYVAANGKVSFAPAAIVDGTTTFSPGETEKTITIQINGDTKVENDETFAVQIANIVGGTLGKATGTATIVNDDTAPVTPPVIDPVTPPVTPPVAPPVVTTPVITVAATTPTAIENGDSGLFTFTRTGGDLSQVLSFGYNIDGTANGRSGYGNTTGTLTFATGSNTATLPVTVAPTTVYTRARTCVASIRSGTGYSIGAGGETGATVNILDSKPEPKLTIGDISIVEGNNGKTNAVFTVTLSGKNADAVTVDYATADGTALDSSDYDKIAGKLTFAPEETSKTITVAINGDPNVEADETFSVTLSNPTNTTLAKVTATGTIGNDDIAPVVTPPVIPPVTPPVTPPVVITPVITVIATNPTATENGAAGLFTFTRTGDLGAALTVDFDLAGNASTRQGYSTRSGAVTFAAGSNTATLPVPVADNGIYNAYRSCVVRLRNGNGYTLGSGGEATVNIVDDDTAPVISIDDVRIAEGNSGTTNATFTVKLSNASDDNVSIDYYTIDDTATTADDDYVATKGRFSFAPAAIIDGTTTFSPGETEKTITIQINGDTQVENDEVFSIQLANAVGGTLGKAIGIATIVNDDTAPVKLPENPPVIEKLTPPVIETITPITPPVIEKFTPPIIETITPITPPVIEKFTPPVIETITPVAPPVIEEFTPPVIKEVTPPVVTTPVITTPTKIEDVKPSISVIATIPHAAETRSNESACPGQFTLRRTGMTADPLTVKYAFGGTATNGIDYIAATIDRVTFAAGCDTAIVNLDIIDDKFYEGAEAVSLTIVNENGYIIADTPTATIDIADNDLARARLHHQSSNNSIDIDGGSAISTLQFTKLAHQAGKRNEIGMFAVDDATGTIDGIKVGTAGYLQAAMNRAQVIFSGLSDSNIDRQLDDIVQRHLSVNPGNQYQFYLVDDSTTDRVKADLAAGKTPTSVIFSQADANAAKSNQSQFTVLADNSGYQIAWDDSTGGDKDFNDLVLKVETLTTAAPLGTQLQGTHQLIDLLGSGTVDLQAIVTGDAAYKNTLGFYTVDNIDGQIGDLKPGDLGYAQAALNRSVMNMTKGDLNPNKTFTGNSLLAPYLVANGTVKDVLTGTKVGQMPQVYFSYMGANSDGQEHVRLLGDNKFAFEDQLGGGDRDFNDAIVQLKITPVG
jgi:Ca2+-binding RTX toxin-like protein